MSSVDSELLVRLKCDNLYIINYNIIILLRAFDYNLALCGAHSLLIEQLLRYRTVHSLPVALDIKLTRFNIDTSKEKTPVGSLADQLARALIEDALTSLR